MWKPRHVKIAFASLVLSAVLVVSYATLTPFANENIAYIMSETMVTSCMSTNAYRTNPDNCIRGMFFRSVIKNWVAQLWTWMTQFQDL